MSNQGFQRLQRFLRRVEPVAGVSPREHVGDGGIASPWISLHKQVSILVLTAYIAGGRCVALRERQVPYRPESGLTICSEEFIRCRPAIERDGKGVTLQHTMHLRKGGLEPSV